VTPTTTYSPIERLAHATFLCSIRFAMVIVLSIVVEEEEAVVADEPPLSL
jgi:hypothetical protein